MTILLARIVPRHQLVAVHAPLGEVEWPGTVAHIEATIPEAVPLILAPVTSGKSLLDRIEERGRFPSPSVRWCTSTLKRGPIQRELRRYLGAHPQYGGAVDQSDGHAGRRKRRTGQEGPLAPQRPHERRRPRGLRLAAHLRSLDRGGVPHHPRRRAVAASRIPPGNVENVLRVLHHGLAFRSPHGRAIATGSLSQVRGA